MNSFYVNSKLRQSVDLGQKYMLDGVPMVIVNGKYKVSGQMAGSYERMIEIINYLVAKEAAK
jgi:thiol:disulfide interchange protein DsbA